MSRKFFMLIFFLFFSMFVYAQELNCRVQINYSQVKTTNQQIFKQMQKDISEFMNMTRWTNYVFAPEERIDCSILLIIKEFDGIDHFRGTIQVSSSRPVYNTSYTTPVLTIREHDGWLDFRYVENQPIEFNERTFTGDLAYTLAFYAYLIIGYDFDTFSENGGAPFFAKLNQIVSNAQSSTSNAWKAMGTNRYDNRYYIARDLNSDVYQPLHQALYKYHRLGLDLMADDISTGRHNVLAALQDLERLYRKRPESFLLRVFLDTKRQEIINIFSQAPMPEAQQAARILKTIDPANASKYNKLGMRMPAP